MIRTKDGESLVDLTGETGAALLDDVTFAVDELAASGVIAKDSSPASDPEPEATTEAVDLDAMKETIDRLKQQGAVEADNAAASAEVAWREQLEAQIVGLRDTLAKMEERISAMQSEQQQVAASKDVVSAATFKSALDGLREHNAKLDGVVAGLFDLVLGVQTGTKEIVIERDGKGSAHDPEGFALAQQMTQMQKSAAQPGGYAGHLFGGS